MLVSFCYLVGWFWLLYFVYVWVWKIPVSASVSVSSVIPFFRWYQVSGRLYTGVSLILRTTSRVCVRLRSPCLFRVSFFVRPFFHQRQDFERIYWCSSIIFLANSLLYVSAGACLACLSVSKIPVSFSSQFLRLFQFSICVRTLEGYIYVSFLSCGLILSCIFRFCLCVKDSSVFSMLVSLHIPVFHWRQESKRFYSDVFFLSSGSLLSVYQRWNKHRVFACVKDSSVCFV